MSKKSPLVASALALAVSSVFAQSTTETTNPLYQLASLDPVVVSASRFEQVLSDVPGYVQVIYREDIEQSAMSSVVEAVQKLGNINVRSTNGGALGVLSTIDMRGFGASARDNTLILVDGVRVSPVDSSSIRWESIPLDSVDRIEIIHGGGSVQFGERAVGGVINIITNTPQLNSHASVQLGSYGTALFNGLLRSKADRLTTQVNFNADATDGWRDNSQAKQAALRGLFSYALNDGDKVFVDTVFSTQKYGTPGGVLGEVNQGNRRAAKFNNVDDRTITNGSRTVFGLQRTLSHQLIVLGEFAYSDSDQTQYTPNSTTTVKQLKYKKNSFDLTPRIKRIFDSESFAVLGIDLQRAEADYSTNTANVQSASVDNAAIYLTYQQKFDRRLMFNGGARRQTQEADAYDKNSGTVKTASKKQSANAYDLGLSYFYGHNLQNKLFLRGNQSYRFANTDEYWGLASDYVTREFKGILRPQTAVTYEFGGVWKLSSQSDLSATLFRINSKDEIRYCVAASCNYGNNINSPDIQRNGVTVGIKYQPIPKVMLQPSLTYQVSEYTAGEFSGKEIPIAPKVLASVHASYQLSRDIRYRISVNHAGDQYYEGDETNTLKKIPAYTTIDVGSQLKKSKWEFDFAVKNLTNERYATFGGYGFVSLTSSTSGNSYYYYPGDPRTFWLGARYLFD